MSLIINPENKLPSYPLALVTGGGHRLGKAFAICLARLGYGIVLHYFSSGEKVAETEREIRQLGVPVFQVKADLRDELDIRSLFAYIDALINQPELNLGPLSVLVNSAAIMPGADIQTMGVHEFDSVIDLNLRAPFLCAQLAYHRMTHGGLIVNISDIAAQKTWKGYPAYTISKAGLDSLTKVMARSFAPRVRVNSIAPGLVLPGEESSPEEWNRLVKRLPVQRAASLDELCAALEFLIKNEYIIGQIIVVDGGFSLI